jgi:hypothetical protein
MTASNALHLANTLVGGMEADYPDKLGEFFDVSIRKNTQALS